MLPVSVVLSDGKYWVYTVRPGDTIWGLTEKHCTSVLHWQRVQRLNQLPDIPARGILPGTRLRFPIDILKHQPANARIHLLHGAAQVVRSAGEELVAAPDIELFSGDRLQVAADSNLTVRFADGSELLVLGGSDIIFDSLSAYGETGMVDTRIRLQSGQVDTRVKSRRGPGSRYEIITPAAVAAVRGTDFRVSAEQGKVVARSEVLEGDVDVAAGGIRRRVPAGFGVLAAAGTPLASPRPLLPAPVLSSGRVVLDRLPLQFNWQALDQAVAYRYQVAGNTNFDSLLANATSPTHRGFLADLPNGDYVMRVRGIDHDGLEGLDAVQHFVVAAHPAPPVLIGLNNAVTVRDPRPEFGWSKPADIERFRVQIAADISFSETHADETGYRSDRFTPATDLAPGSYFWRVASIDSAGLQGPWSDAAAFTYRVIPGAPETESPALGESSVEFQWQDAGAGMQYQFQLDSEKDFTSASIDRRVTEPRLAVDRPVAGEYFFRVRAIDDSGYAGPWSTTQAVVIPGNPWQLLVPLLLLF